MRVVATVGRESHTTSSGWASVKVDGRQLSHRDAVSKEYKTKYGDRHAFWVECVFEIPEGATVVWEAGANSGGRGSDRRRQNLTLVADPGADIFESEDIGYPASHAKLSGRLRLVSDAQQEAARNHATLKANL